MCQILRQPIKNRIHLWSADGWHKRNRSKNIVTFCCPFPTFIRTHTGHTLCLWVRPKQTCDFTSWREQRCNRSPSLERTCIDSEPLNLVLCWEMFPTDSYRNTCCSILIIRFPNNWTPFFSLLLQYLNTHVEQLSGWYWLSFTCVSNEHLRCINVTHLCLWKEHFNLWHNLH